jgi:hypothetical protein
MSFGACYVIPREIPRGISRGISRGIPGSLILEFPQGVPFEFFCVLLKGGSYNRSS